MRLLVTADADPALPGWQVRVTCPDEPAWERTRAMHQLDSGGLPLPAPAGEPVADAERVLAAYRAVTGRQPGDGDVGLLGRHLFATLLGTTIWEDAHALAGRHGAGTVELALAFDRDEQALHRVNWELLHDGHRFLAAGRDGFAVAVTRVVRGAWAAPAPLRSPPRVLFAVAGVLGDPRLRPGAEYLGFLRQLKDGHAVHPDVLQRATPKRLREAVTRFAPDAVYLVGHGSVDDAGRGYLELPDDEGGDPRRYAEQLLDYLRAGERLPPVVVLSVCYSGGGAERATMLGPARHGALAAELVAGGVPVVLGMAGRVSDLACRLFTRRFGEALAGEPLIAAAAEARRAAFADGNPPHRTADWAFPALFLSEAVPHDYTPVPAPGDADATQVRTWARGLNLERAPVFCAREDFFEDYRELFAPEGRAVLAAHTAAGEPGIGRTRLLQELSWQALRDGHVPVLVIPGDDPPRTVAALADKVARAIGRVRRVLEVEQSALSTQLQLLRRADPGPSLLPELRDLLDFGGEVGPEALGGALAADLADLAAGARAAGRGDRVLVLLDDVDRYDQAAAALLDQHDPLLGYFGLGTTREPVPVVMTFARSTELMRQVVEQGATRPWLRLRELRPFAEQGDEDLRAYELVLLNPCAHNVLPEVSGTAWSFNPDAADVEGGAAEWVPQSFRLAVRGLPGRLATPVFYTAAFSAAKVRFLVPADDEDRLARIRGVLP